MTRAFILLLDSLGVGAAPDAASFGDAGANTLGHIAQWMLAHSQPLALPHLEQLGLGAAAALAYGAWPAGMARREGFSAAYGAARERSTGKDTQSGHWEIAGVPVDFEWGYFSLRSPSFPKDLTENLQARTGISGCLGNCHASGTEIIQRLGDEHVRTGKVIVYTSADSVFQIAAHEDHFGLDRLYSVCETAFELVKPYNIGRVIARPFVGSHGHYQRTANRRDFAVAPPSPTLLDHVRDVGHRRDVAGYAQALQAFDRRLPEFQSRLRSGDLAVITADHGCDPTWQGSDHTREHIPMLFFGPEVKAMPLGVSSSFSDIGQTLAHHLALKPLSHGHNVL